MISLITAMGRNGVIGHNGGLPWHCPTDLKRFKALTIGHSCIVGRKTYESLPPLPGRKLIVMTRQRKYDAPLVAGCFIEAVGLADGEVFIIGGAEVYQRALTFVDRMYVTVMHGDYDGDTYFPEFDLHEWVVTGFEIHDDHHFKIMERVNVRNCRS